MIWAATLSISNDIDKIPYNTKHLFKVSSVFLDLLYVFYLYSVCAQSSGNVEYNVYDMMQFSNFI